MSRPIAFRIGVLLVVLAASVSAACRPATLTGLVEARRFAAELHVQFTKAADAANRGVMADADDASASAAREAQSATQAVERDVKELRSLLESLGYAEELRDLDAFNQHFTEYRKLDEEILPLAIENSNLKAQRLSFGPARDAAEAFRASLEAAPRPSSSKESCCADVLAARAGAALFEIQVLHASHIAEAEDAAMTRMEQRMTAVEATAQKLTDELKGQLGAGPRLAAAAAALERFKSVNREIVTLSRRNSEVRSLALSLGRKRVVASLADDQLRALDDALAKHAFTATR